MDELFEALRDKRKLFMTAFAKPIQRNAMEVLGVLQRNEVGSE